VPVSGARSLNERVESGRLRNLDCMTLRAQSPQSIALRGVGTVALARISEANRRLLLDSAEPAEVLRDRWLVACTDLSEPALTRLSETARHRLGLALLRSLDLEKHWKRGYGSSEPAPERMWKLVAAHLATQEPPSTTPKSHPGSFTTTPGSLAPIIAPELAASVRRSLAQAGAQVRESARRNLQLPIERATNLVRPALTKVVEQIARFVRSLTDTVGRSIRSSAFRESMRVVRTQQQRVEQTIAEPLSALIRAGRIYAGQERPRTPPDIVVGEAALALPDDASLATFYADRGDPSWRVGELGWLLAALPLSIGGVLHKHFGVSLPAGLGFVAERFARREMRRHLRRAITELNCSESLRQRLTDGVGLFLDERYHSADTLLSASLDGLLFETGRARGLLTPGNKLIEDGKTKGKIKTGSDGRLLHALELDPSKQAFLSGVSAGKPGNRPRHGADAEVGSREHAAAALLGVLLLLSEQGDKRAVARVLV
jgi:hypothetical protein